MNSLLVYTVIIAVFLTGTSGVRAAVPASELTPAAEAYRLPEPGARVHLSSPLDPPLLKGIKVYPGNPFRFDFILDSGSHTLLKQEADKLIKYFLAGLTIPEKDLWVNLSPYEKDRIVPNSFGLTEMGRDLLAEDYILKQITASLIYPEDQTGKRFWKRIYEEALKRYGTTHIPVNTFNKVWIIPERVVVFENIKTGTAYILESKLKVMLEEDYLSFEKHNAGQAGYGQSGKTGRLASRMIREIIIPELNAEVNKNANFAKLRQAYNSLILAVWYKKKIADNILAQVYADKNKIAGLRIKDPLEKEKIYQRYLQAFRKGVYNYIRTDLDAVTQQAVPRKYFSGGMNINPDAAMVIKTGSSIEGPPLKAYQIMVDLSLQGQDLAMKALESYDLRTAQGREAFSWELKEFIQLNVKRQYPGGYSSMIKSAVKDPWSVIQEKDGYVYYSVDGLDEYVLKVPSGIVKKIDGYVQDLPAFELSITKTENYGIHTPFVARWGKVQLLAYSQISPYVAAKNITRSLLDIDERTHGAVSAAVACVISRKGRANVLLIGAGAGTLAYEIQNKFGATVEIDGINKEDLRISPRQLWRQVTRGLFDHVPDISRVAEFLKDFYDRHVFIRDVDLDGIGVGHKRYDIIIAGPATFQYFRKKYEILSQIKMSLEKNGEAVIIDDNALFLTALKHGKGEEQHGSLEDELNGPGPIREYALRPYGLVMRNQDPQRPFPLLVPIGDPEKVSAAGISDLAPPRWRVRYKINTGGIDLSSVGRRLQSSPGGGTIRLSAGLALPQYLKDAQGFVPVIINIKPLHSLPEFLGVDQSGIMASQKKPQRDQDHV